MVAWTLVFHIIGLVFWLGSLLAVTHVMAIHIEAPSVEARATLGRLESKLLRGFAHPGAAIMVITGFILVARESFFLHAYWLHIKLFLVAVLVALDLWVTFRARALQEGRAGLSRGECRALHGTIALVFFGIVILAVVKPFGSSRPHAQVGRTDGQVTRAVLRGGQH
jgi:protoporphyrinogen IX oxidase